MELCRDSSSFRMIKWALISDLMPGPTGKQGRPFADARTMVEGIIYRHRCGSRGGISRKRSAPGRPSGGGIAAWLVTVPGIRRSACFANSQTVTAWSTGQCRWTPRSRVRISTRRTSRA